RHPPHLARAFPDPPPASAFAPPVPAEPNPAFLTGTPSGPAAEPTNEQDPITGSRNTSTSTAAAIETPRFPPPDSGLRLQTTPTPTIWPYSLMPPTIAASTVTPLSSTKTPPRAATSALLLA